MTEQPMLLLHVYPQAEYHDTLHIVGEPNALYRLGVALCNAAKRGGEHNLKSLMTGDGEGYDVLIQTAAPDTMSQAPLPYAQLGLPWEFERIGEAK